MEDGGAERGRVSPYRLGKHDGIGSSKPAMKTKDAALVMQKLVRGFFVRRWSIKRLKELRAQRRALTWDLADSLIKELLEQELIPDLLVEIVTNLSPEAFAPYPGWLKEQLDMAEEVVKAVVEAEAQLIVREASRELVKHYLVAAYARGTRSPELTLCAVVPGQRQHREQDKTQRRRALSVHRTRNPRARSAPDALPALPRGRAPLHRRLPNRLRR